MRKEGGWGGGGREGEREGGLGGTKGRRDQGVVTISLRFRQSQFKGPIWTLSEVMSSSPAFLSLSFIRCLTIRRGSAGRPGSARPSNPFSARLGLARPGSAADGVFTAVWPGLARPGSAAEVIFGSHRGAASAAPEYYSQSRIYVRPLSTLCNGRRIFCVILCDI